MNWSLSKSYCLNVGIMTESAILFAHDKRLCLRIEGWSFYKLCHREKVKRKADQSDVAFHVRSYEDLGLERKPFTLAPDPAFYFSSRSHTEAVGQLLSFLQRDGGLALVFGDVGTGKTILSRHILESVSADMFDVCLIFNPLMTEMDFFGEIFQKFHITADSSQSPQEMGSIFKSHLLMKSNKGRKLLLVIDEAQILPDDMLSFLESLVTHKNGDYSPNLYIILFAQLEIMGRFMAPRLRAIRAATSLTCYIHPLGADEIDNYIMHRLSLAGSDGSIRFTREASAALYAASSGCPRIINTLCDQSILMLCDSKKKVVNEKVLKKILEGGTFLRRRR
jgi:type II secretory pathway predicted ATPase ExeA